MDGMAPLDRLNLLLPGSAEDYADARDDLVREFGLFANGAGS